MEQIVGGLSAQAPAGLGVRVCEGGVEAAVWSRHADAVWFCLFDERGSRETGRWLLSGRQGDIRFAFIPGVGPGARYGLRADGPWAPEQGHRFDPAKLLLDPYARRIDRPFVWRAELAAPRAAAIDTAPFTPRAIVEAPMPSRPFCPQNCGATLIYEVGVRSFSRLRPDIPEQWRGTLRALRDPRVIDHLVRLGVSHVELMPVTAWIDERHLAPLGLANAWGYNPASFFALDPRLAPGGWRELAGTIAALHGAGIGVLLDVVFNHTGESDDHGPTLSLRGLDNAVYYRHDPDSGRMINDTGCGNTLAADREPVQRLVLDNLRALALETGVDGFRFDLAATLARGPGGVDPQAPLLAAIASDPVLAERVLIAEPWDIGPGGYCLGHFPPPWREWNDRYRDGVRRFWSGETGAAGELATRISGSADIFGHTGRGPEASVNFIAAHDGFTLRDLVAYTAKRNHANGEDNRDGHDANHSWNCGQEGESDDPQVLACRGRDVRALLATLFLSRGAPMLAAGDEFGRTQRGNNNAYAQDNEITWLDWQRADEDLIRYTATLMDFRRRFLTQSHARFLTGEAVCPGASSSEGSFPDVVWLRPDGAAKDNGDWAHADQVCLVLAIARNGDVQRLYIAFNRSERAASFTPPPPRPGHAWRLYVDSSAGLVHIGGAGLDPPETAPARGVMVLCETRAVAAP